MNKNGLFTWLAVLSMILVAGCAPEPQPAPEVAGLRIEVLYPAQDTEVEMGRSIKSIVRVSNDQGELVEDARVKILFRDPGGETIDSMYAFFGAGGVYRTEAWQVPHRMKEGAWTLTVEAEAPLQQGSISDTFRVDPSISETLLEKYGFWVNEPTLRGIPTMLAREMGDAHNGAITWGGVTPAQHVFPESWLEVQWRAGEFDLGTESDVREFMLNTLGNPGFYPTRNLGPFQRTRFKDWDAWQVKARGELSRYDEQWVIFYAPQADKTYALGTTVVQAPVGIDPHAALRDSFELHPEVDANGVAPLPLHSLLPPPVLIGPELGATFFGVEQPIILQWQPVKDLAEDEYYLVSVDFNYAEGNTLTTFTTRDTRIPLPESFYSVPNCSVFNWQVVLVQQTGTDPNGQPEGTPLSYNSFYSYIRWFYPPGEEVPFGQVCPNQQF